MEFKSLVSQYKSYFVLFALFIVVGGVFLLSNSREETHLVLNQFFHSSLHPFFKIVTYLGDGLSLAIVVACLLFYKYGYALFLGLSGAISGGFTQILKNYFFGELVRPGFHFRFYSDYDIQLVPGLDLNIHNSFPSGHTTAAFCLLTALMLISGKSKSGWAFFLLAFVIGYSRVYLSQHFFVDVYFGAIIGSLFTIFIFILFENFRKKQSPIWFEKSILRR